MRNAMLALPAILLLAACQKEEPEATPTSRATPEASAAAAPAPAAKGVARSVDEDNDLYEFTYSYPAQAGAIPALKAWLDADLDKQKAELVQGAKEGKQVAAEGGFPYNPYASQSEWKVVTDLPGWLSLSGTIGGYTGGAHPNYAHTALLWDKAAGQQREAADLFESKAALSDAIREPFCRALDAQRAKKREVKAIDRNSGNQFDECVDPVESAIILGSSNRQTFDRIGVLVSPYEAGPYVEGDYDVTLPVTPAVLAAVKPQFRAFFAVKR